MSKGMAFKRFLAAMGVIAVIHMIFFYMTWSKGFHTTWNGPGFVWLVLSIFILGPAMVWNIGRFIGELFSPKRDC